MRRALLGVMGAVALGAVGVLVAGFIWPDVESEVDIGSVEAFPPGSVTAFYFPPGGTEPRTNDLADPAWRKCQRFAGELVYIVGLEDGEIVAFSGRSSHLGGLVAWRPDQSYDGERGVFMELCHSERWDIDGTRVFGPAPRNLDRFGLRIEDGRVIVDLRDVTEGYRAPQPEYTPDPPGWTPQPTALATEPPTPSPTPAAP